MKKSRKLRNICLLIAIFLSISMSLMTLRLPNDIFPQNYFENFEYSKGLKDSATVSQFWNYTTGGDVISSPALGDLDGDGKLEVLIGSSDSKIYALNGEDGTQVWNYPTGGAIYSSPALGDITGYKEEDDC